MLQVAAARSSATRNPQPATNILEGDHGTPNTESANSTESPAITALAPYPKKTMTAGSIGWILTVAALLLCLRRRRSIHPDHRTLRAIERWRFGR